ncbi:MAG: ArgE/DapE family deacylase [Chloroflexota bacterium]
MNQPLTIDADYVISTLQKLVQINSSNPTLSTDGVGETEIAHYTAECLRALNIPVDLVEVAPNRWNVVGRLQGRGNGRSLLLNAHLDTVSVTGMTAPFSGEIRDGKLYGRGAQDMKSGLAAQLGAAKAIIDAGIELNGDLLITAVADEEDKSIGMDHLVTQYTADAAIVTEPTSLQLCRAHRGFIWYDVVTKGRAAHGSRYQEGIDANMRMGRFLGELEKLEQALLKRPPHPLAGPPSLHASKISGGTEISVYSAECVLQIERRTAPGETEAECTAELQTIIDYLSQADTTFNATVKPFFVRDPFSIEESAHIVNTVEKAATQQMGYSSEHGGVSFWTDAAILAAKGIDTVIIGPTGAGLHSAEEWVEIQSVLDLTHILANTAVDFCGASSNLHVEE